MEPSSEVICRTALEIKAGIDSARKAGVECGYPLLFEIDGHVYSFATCVAECSGSQNEVECQK
jgi:hypothetical protein